VQFQKQVPNISCAPISVPPAVFPTINTDTQLLLLYIQLYMKIVLQHFTFLNTKKLVHSCTWIS